MFALCDGVLELSAGPNLRSACDGLAAAEHRAQHQAYQEEKLTTPASIDKGAQRQGKSALHYATPCTSPVGTSSHDGTHFAPRAALIE